MNYDFGGLIGIEEKALKETDDSYQFTGYAAVFGNKDHGDDIIERGAFAESLKSHGLPLLLFNHRMNDLPIGVIEHAEEDRRGLLVAGELPKDDPVANRVGIMLRARKNGNRALKGMSIGYKTEQSHKKDGARILTKLRLYEASFVNMPMNPLAGVETLKSATMSVDEFKTLSDRAREAHLRSLGFSDSWSKYMTAKTRDAVLQSKAQREAGDGSGRVILPDFAANIRQLTGKLTSNG
jgi:uncharacterized protein